MSGTLAGMSVLVTRPAHQAEGLCRMIEMAGGKPVRLPLLSLEPVPPSARVQKVLHDGHSADWWIFTSANAVRHARELDRGEWPRQLAAVGPATAAALEAGGMPVLAPVTSHSGEALLALPQMQDVAGKRIVIVTGEAGLEVLGPGLRARGAQVQMAEVYRRVPLPYDEARVLAALRGVDAMIVTSGAALEHLVKITPETSRESLYKRALVLPSERVAALARGLGFRAAQAVEQMSDAALLRALESMAENTRS